MMKLGRVSKVTKGQPKVGWAETEDRMTPGENYPLLG